MTITGTVNEFFQIVTDEGKVYGIADSEVSEEVLKMVDKKVRLTRTVYEKEGAMMIKITNYEVPNQKPWHEPLD
jgi:hypothetical protein